MIVVEPVEWLVVRLVVEQLVVPWPHLVENNFVG